MTWVFSSLYTTVPQSRCFARCTTPNPPSAIGCTSVNSLNCICLCHSSTNQWQLHRFKPQLPTQAHNMLLKKLYGHRQSKQKQQVTGAYSLESASQGNVAFPFSALTLLVGRQEDDLACRKLGVGLLMVMIYVELYTSSSCQHHFHHP